MSYQSSKDDEQNYELKVNSVPKAEDAPAPEPRPEEALPASDQNGEQNAGESEHEEINKILYGHEYAQYQDSLGEPEEEDRTPEELLSTFRNSAVLSDDSKMKTGTSRKMTVIGICIAALAVFAVLFFVLGPSGLDVFGFRPQQDGERIELLEGEQLASNNRILMFEHVQRENIQSIEVHNAHGTYTAYYDRTDKAYYYLGAEGMPYDQTLFSNLIVSAGYTLTTARLDADKVSKDLSVYGLAPEDNPAYYILTKMDGTQYKVYIGVSTMEEDGYYARFDGRDAVYILGSEIKSSLLADFKDMLTPLLTYPLENSGDYINIKEFGINRDGENFLQIQYTGDDPAYESEYGAKNAYMIIKPQSYSVSTNNFTQVLQKAAVVTGEKIVAYNVYEVKTRVDEQTGKEEEYMELIPELVKPFGLEKPKYQLYYRLNDFYTLLEISEKQTDEDGNEFYYVASMLYNTVAKVPAASLDFLEWDLIRYVRKEIYLANIDKVNKIEVVTASKHYDFVLTGKGEALSVMEMNEKRGYQPDVKNFRNFYGTLVSIYNEDFKDEPLDGEKELLLELIITMQSGNKLHYKFYAYSERRCYYTLNDEGQFYVLRTSVKLLSDNAQRLIDGETVVFS